MILEPKIKTLTNHKTAQHYRVYDSSGISPTLGAGNEDRNGKNTLIAMPVLTPDRAKKRQDGRRPKTNGEPMSAAQDRHGIYDGYRVRRLTPLECERLQCFPDNFTMGVSDAQRYKQCGNAVTVDVVEFVGNLLN